MQYVQSFSFTPMACPQCETELDHVSGVCPACRWDHAIAAAAVPTEEVEDEASFTERYRGTKYHHLMAQIQDGDEGAGRTRLLLIVGLVGILGLFYIVGDALYLF